MRGGASPIRLITPTAKDQAELREFGRRDVSFCFNESRCGSPPVSKARPQGPFRSLPSDMAYSPRGGSNAEGQDLYPTLKSTPPTQLGGGYFVSTVTVQTGSGTEIFARDALQEAMEVETNGNLKFGMAEHAPQEDVWPSADGMSSDATVVCIDSDGEEEAESQAEEYDPGLESRLKEKGLATEAAKYGSRVNDAALYSQLRETRRGDSDLFRIAHAGKRVSWGREQELAEAEALALASALRTLDANPPRSDLYQTHDERWKQDPAARCQRRKKGGNNNNGVTEARKGALPSGWGHERTDGERVEADSQPPQGPQSQAQGPRGNKRRGRRGGRGRKHADREAAGEVPKLEKNLEDELAEQMANQASNESALAQSFSSLRLHVAGGGTMIILNDREITDTTPQNGQSHCTAQSAAHSVKEKQEEGKKPAAAATAAATNLPAGSCSAKGLGLSRMNTSSAMARSGLLASLQSLRNSRRGCGAFFPPQLLAQVQQGDKVPQPRRVSLNTEAGASNSVGKKLSAKAQPFVPVASPSAATQHNRSVSQYTSSGLSGVNRRSSTNAGLPHAGASGTGCFMPIYLQEHEEKTSPCHKVMKASLAESLSSLSEVDFSLQRSRLRLQAPPSKASSQNGLEDNATEFFNKETVLESGEVVSEARANYLREKSVSMGGCNFVMSRKHRRNPTTPAEELLSIIDKGEEFTTFTSPLHLEETLEGLEAEQAALEETQEKMIDLEMENTDLKKTIDTITASTMDVDKLKCANTTLQLLLFVALAKSENAKTGAEIPRGMFGNAGQLGVQELEAVKEKLSSKNSELLQIQKDLEKNSSELQNLSETWLNGLSMKKESSEAPQTPQKAKDKATSDPRNSALKTTFSKNLASKRSASAKSSSSKSSDKFRTGATVIRRASTKNFQSEVVSDNDILSKCHSEKAKKSIFPTQVAAPKKAAAKPLWR